MSKAPVMLIAEARMAVQHLEQAERWAADFDEELVTGMALIERQLLKRIEQFLQSRGTFAAPPPLGREHQRSRGAL
jgi:hypothetical protein